MNDDDIYEQANREAQEACDQCNNRTNYVCTYHEGWADGFEAGWAAVDRQE